MTPPLRIGTLGAARITPMALLRPARQVPGVAVVAVAARDVARAERFAGRHGIPRVLASYEALLDDPDIDAVYNPLPNSCHAEWSIRALRAGKHVLCEKPLASNADEAASMVAAADESGRVLVEAFHWRHHPLAARMKAVVQSGELGAIRHVEATMCIPLPLPRDIRWRFDLGGGAMMDTGCYTVSIVRHLAGAEPEVTRAETRLWGPDIDRWTTADLAFDDGRTGRVTCALLSRTLLRIEARAAGERGTMRVINPVLPQFFHRLVVRTAAGRRVETVPGDATYVCQLRDFAAACRGEAPPRWPATDAVANMRVIDAVYAAAGMRRRGA